MATKRKVAIIGGGVSGLAVAHQLQKQGVDFALYELSPRLGGAVQSVKEDGYLFEKGPNSLQLNDRRILDFLTELDLQDSIQQANPLANKRFILHKGKPVALPYSLKSAITNKLFTIREKFRLLAEPYLTHPEVDDLSFGEVIRTRLGQAMLDQAAGPFVSGIYAGDAEKISTRYAFPKLWRMLTEHQSFIRATIALKRSIARGTADPNRLPKRSIISFPDGLEAIPKAITKELPKDKIHLSSILLEIKQEDGLWKVAHLAELGKITHTDFTEIVIATPAHKIQELPLPEEVQERFVHTKNIDFPGVASLVIGFKREDVEHPLDGFGMLSSLREESPIMGVLFSSTLFAGRVPEDHVLLTVMIGGARHPEHLQAEEVQILERTYNTLQPILGIKGMPSFYNNTTWPRAIPQINLGHEKVLSELDAIEHDFSNLHIVGNYRNGVSLNDCILNGLNLGEKLAKLPPLS